jgi:hypothetical protein
MLCLSIFQQVAQRVPRLEDAMRNLSAKLFLLSFTFLWLAAGDSTVAQEPPANVAGNCTIQQHILFHTKTHTVLTFRGRVDGPRVEGTVQGGTISGTYRDEHGLGQWHAVRSE